MVEEIIPIIRIGTNTYRLVLGLFGVYNFVGRHHSLGTTPAVAAGIEEKPWSLEQVVEMTAAYVRRKEDAEFEAAFAELER